MNFFRHFIHLHLLKFISSRLVGFCKPDLSFVKILDFLTFVILINISWHCKCRPAPRNFKFQQTKGLVCKTRTGVGALAIYRNIQKTWEALKMGSKIGFLAPHFFHYAISGYILKRILTSEKKLNHPQNHMIKRKNKYYNRSRISEKKFREIIKYFYYEAANKTAICTSVNKKHNK